MTTHASTLTEAVATAKPIRGTRYAIGSFLPTVGLSPRPRPIYVLTLDGVEVDRGSKADLMLCAKSPEGSPLGACHDRYTSTLAKATGAVVEDVPELTNHVPADIARAIYNTHRTTGLAGAPEGMAFLIANGAEVTIHVGSKVYTFTVTERDF